MIDDRYIHDRWKMIDRQLCQNIYMWRQTEYSPIYGSFSS